MGGRNRSSITVWLLATLQRKPEKTERGRRREEERKTQTAEQNQDENEVNKKRDNERKEQMK